MRINKLKIVATEAQGEWETSPIPSQGGEKLPAGKLKRRGELPAGKFRGESCANSAAYGTTKGKSGPTTT